MCGINGIINSKTSKERRLSTVENMNQTMIHRGPDEDGFFNDEHCTLAMRRLSIIDLHSGKQPIYNEDKSLCIVFNGEIYNFQELKERLIKNGHQFRTNSDTEVIVHLYEEEKYNTPKFLKGMFAFCIYDLRNKEWFIARDRFGEKPLFYYHKGDAFSFSSEIKSLLEDKSIPRQLNQNALPYYLTTSYVPEPFTLLKDIYTLKPGHSLIFKNNEVKTQPYFKVDYTPNQDLKTEEDCKDYLKPILEKAVKRQMISDVPLGAFLSGGIDSSTVVANMQRISDKPIKTFTVRFQESKYDESPIAKEVSKHLGTDHHEITVPNSDFSEDIFWEIIDRVGFPFPDSSAIPSFFITKEIRKHVTVALSGDGGDELFGGYTMFQWWMRVLSLKKKYPSVLRKAMLGGAELLSHVPKVNEVGLIRQAKRALTVAEYPVDGFGMALHNLYPAKDIAKYVNINAKHDYSLLSVFPKEAKNWTDLRKAMYYRLIHNLPLDMLIKVDRMSMANSLEVRAPFLDVDLFTASQHIPDEFLIKNGKGKYILRELMKDYLPESVFNHPKSGFSIPLHKYFNADFKKLIKELITEGNSPLDAIIDKKYVEQILHEGLHNQTNNAKSSVYQSSHRLWSLVQLYGWVKRFDVTI